MKKIAFRSLAGKLRHVKRVIQTSPKLKGSLIGVPAGALYGTGLAAEYNLGQKRGTSEASKERKKVLKQGILIGAIAGGLSGRSIGKSLGAFKDSKRSIKKRIFKESKSLKKRRAEDEVSSYDEHSMVSRLKRKKKDFTKLNSMLPALFSELRSIVVELK